MFTAIHKLTGIEIIASDLVSINETIRVRCAHDCGFRIENVSELLDGWFNEHTFLCPKESIVNSENFGDVEVKFRKGCLKPYKDKEKGTFRVRSHFYIPKKNERGIKTISESAEHKNAIIAIRNEINENENLAIRITPDIVIPFSSFKLRDLSVNQERSLYSLNPESNISDLLAVFTNYNEKLGQGICIEVQFSNKSDADRRLRTESWANMGFSIAWVEKEDFEWDDKEHPALKSDELTVIPYSHTENKRLERNQKAIDYVLVKNEEKYQDLKVLEKKITAEHSDKMYQVDCRQKELDSNQRGLLSKVDKQYFQTSAPAIDSFKEKITKLSEEKSNQFLEFETTKLKEDYATIAAEVLDTTVMMKYAEKFNEILIRKYLCLSCVHCKFPSYKNELGKWISINPLECPEYRYIRTCWALFKIEGHPETIDISEHDEFAGCRNYAKRRE